MIKLPKYIQKKIWKYIFKFTLLDLKKNTIYISGQFTDDAHRDFYKIQKMENTVHYRYIKFDDNSWALGLGFGRGVSNFDQLRCFPRHKQ